MTDEATAGKTADATVAAEAADKTADKTNVDTGTDKSAADKAVADKSGDDDKKGDAGKVSVIPDDWRELASNGDDDTLKLLKRYGSVSGVAKALKEAQNTIRSGKVKRDMPDPSNAEAMAEWRKAEGIPDDPSGYKLPDAVIKRMSDEDKPMIASFTDFAHKKGAPQAVIDTATEWYFDMAEQAATKQAEADAAGADETETILRKDWAPGEYKANLTLGKRYVESIPGVGADWTEARMPDGRKLGNIPEFIQWASDQGRQQFGDVTFATADSEAKHASRRAEIEKIRDTDFDRYESDRAMQAEYRAIIEKDLARNKR